MKERSAAEIAIKSGATIGEVIDRISRERDSAKAMVSELIPALENLLNNSLEGASKVSRRFAIERARMTLEKAKG